MIRSTNPHISSISHLQTAILTKNSENPSLFYYEVYAKKNLYVLFNQGIMQSTYLYTQFYYACLILLQPTQHASSVPLQVLLSVQLCDLARKDKTAIL
jgi:hypothetical protein